MVSSWRLFEANRAMLRHASCLPAEQIGQLERLERELSISGNKPAVHLQLAVAYMSALIDAHGRDGELDPSDKRMFAPRVDISRVTGVQTNYGYIRHKLRDGTIALIRRAVEPGFPLTVFAIERDRPFEPNTGRDVALWWLAGSPDFLGNGQPFGPGLGPLNRVAAVARLYVGGLDDDEIEKLASADPGLPERWSLESTLRTIEQRTSSPAMAEALRARERTRASRET